MGGAEIDTEKVLICNNASKIMKEQFLLDRITIEHENFFNAIIKK